MSAPGSIIKIKRSPNVGAPGTLAQGEMAYSYAAGGYNLLGDRLFIGTGTETAGNAAVQSAIGGLYYTRLIDASIPGTLTTNANSIPVLSSTGTIDKWYAGNTYIYDNKITTTATNGNLNLDPNGTGMVKIADTWTLPRSAGTNNYILNTNGSNTATWSQGTTYIGSTAVNLFNSSGTVGTLSSVNLTGGNYDGNYVKVSDIGFGPALGTTNSDSAVRIETGASGTVNHLWTFNANGTTSFNNAAYTFPNVDATSSGYVLKSDAAGNVTWQSAGNLATITTAGNTTTNDITVGSLTASNLASGRIPYATTGSKLTDSTNLQWDNGNQVLKAGAGGAEIGGDSGYGYVKAADVQTGKISNNSHYWLFNANGTTTFNSAYTLPSADGTGGYILKTYGNGVVYWDSATAAQIQADYTQTDTGAADYIKNKPTLFSGSYTDLTSKPNLSVYATTASLATVATSGLYSDLSGTPSLATVATSGSYADLTGKPNLAVYATTASLANVATSGSYNDLIDKPILAAYLNLTGDSGSGNVALLNDTVDFVGLGPIVTSIARVGNIVSVSSNVSYATTATIGVASFSSANFDVTAGAVSLKAGGITNASLANSNVTIGSTTVNLGTTVTAFAGLTSFQIGNIKIYSDNQITTQETNGNINLRANGTGVIDVGNTRISSLSDPTEPYDAATKHYVDAVASGLHVHAPAIVATTDTLAALTTGGTVTYNNGTSGDGATLTLQNAITLIDGQTFGVDFTSDDRILVKDQANPVQNGVYTISANGKVLTRAIDFNTTLLVHGGDFIFVVKGTRYGSTGWVQTTDAVALGSDSVVFLQFAGLGTYLADQGLYLDGSTFKANVNSTSGGIEIVSNQFQLKSTLAGNGLTYTTGVLDIGGTADRISISSDAIDIASTYVGQTSITTLGNITTGTWSGNVVATGYGGTGLSSYTAGDILYASSTNTLGKIAKGTDGQLLTMVSGAPTWSTLDGGTY